MTFYTAYLLLAIQAFSATLEDTQNPQFSSNFVTTDYNGISLSTERVNITKTKDSYSATLQHAQNTHQHKARFWVQEDYKWGTAIPTCISTLSLEIDGNPHSVQLLGQCKQSPDTPTQNTYILILQVADGTTPLSQVLGQYKEQAKHDHTPPSNTTNRTVLSYITKARIEQKTTVHASACLSFFTPFTPKTHGVFLAISFNTAFPTQVTVKYNEAEKTVRLVGHKYVNPPKHSIASIQYALTSCTQAPLPSLSIEKNAQDIHILITKASPQELRTLRISLPQHAIWHYEKPVDIAKFHYNNATTSQTTTLSITGIVKYAKGPVSPNAVTPTACSIFYMLNGAVCKSSYHVGMQVLCPCYPEVSAAFRTEFSALPLDTSRIKICSPLPHNDPTQTSLILDISTKSPNIVRIRHGDHSTHTQMFVCDLQAQTLTRGITPKLGKKSSTGVSCMYDL